MTRGFSLIQLSLLLMVASLALVACLPNLQTTPAARGATVERMNTILTAMRQFESANGRLPCPADASQPMGGSLYGTEATNNGSAGNCTGGSPAANYIDSANHVAVGMVPVRTLGLAFPDALDAWGRTLTYAVDTNATSCFTTSLPGAITVTDNGGAQATVTALVSHGEDGHGAWIPRPGNDGAAVRLDTSSTDADQLTNAHVTNGFIPTMALNNFVRRQATPTFDDLVVYRNGAWNLNTEPAAASVNFPRLTGPATGTYISGQTLTFSLNYGNNVTVTGLPRLLLTVGSFTRYAIYASGSGTATLLFRYVVQPSDYAPGGITVFPSVDMNGGSMSAPCNAFFPPPLSAVNVLRLYVYVADYNNNRVQKFDAYGNYLAQFGTAGILNGQLAHPKQPVVDGSGNVWVSDSGNSRVEEFNAAGTYESKFGSLGILNGQFATSGSTGIDHSGNLWVVDEVGNRIEKFDASGNYLGQFGSGGALNGQFALPAGIAVDAAGNLWVGDWGNNRLQKFSSGGIYLGKFGSPGTGNGQFLNPCGQAIDASGNIWVADNGNNRVQEFDAVGNYLGQFGSLGTGNGKFAGPCGIAVDLSGNVWVGDAGNNRVEKFDPGGNYLLQLGSFGTGNGQFWVPSGIALYYQ